LRIDRIEASLVHQQGRKTCLAKVPVSGERVAHGSLSHQAKTQAIEIRSQN
jgi:hypothetical protein